MSVSFVDNAIYTKARAMHGKLLTKENYEQLLASRSVNEVANYLKTKTAYEQALENISGTDIRRKPLETAIRKSMLDNCASLAEYELLMGIKFYKYFVLKDEVFMILKCANGFCDDMDYAVSPFTKKHSSIDFEKLAAADSFENIMSVLEKTDYYDILKSVSKQDENIRYLMLETSLTNYLNTELYKLTCSCFKGKEKTEILDYLKLQADAKRVMAVYRIIKSFAMDKVIAAHLFSDELTRFSETEIKKITFADSVEELNKILGKTVYAKGLAKYSDVPAEKVIARYLFDLSKHTLIFSQNKILVMLCYVYLAETEITKITRLAEGIRYSLPTEEIRALID